MRTKTRWAFRGVATGAALLATLQPFLGSVSLFVGGGIDWERLHLIVGGILYNLSIVLIVLAPLTKFRRRWMLLGLSVAQYVLVHVQLSLGLGSREDGSLLAYHIPLGVLIFGLSYAVLLLSLGARLEVGEA